MICLTGFWATVHEILAIKISKKTVKILILDQMVFAVVVYFERYLCVNNANYDQIYPF